MGTLNENLHVQGSLSCTTFAAPASSIGKAAIAPAAGIEATKLQHQYESIFRQDHGTAAVAQRQVLHRVQGATAELVAFRCGVVVAATGNSTVSIDLRKNGTTVLTAVTVLDSTNLAYAVEDAAGFTSTALVAGDVLEVVVTVSAGTGTLPQGLFCQAIIREDAA